MTTNAHEERCEFCWNPNVGKHNKGCPELIGTAEAREEWQRGADVGFADSAIPYWEWDKHSLTFILGYSVGKAEIDRMVDQAAQDNIWGPTY